MGDKVFVSAKKIILYRDSFGLEKTFPHLRKFYKFMETYTGDKIQIEEPPVSDREPDPGSGKKRLPKGHAASGDRDVTAPEEKMTRYFTIDNDRLMNYLRRDMSEFMQKFYKPNTKTFVMKDKDFQQFRKFLQSPKIVDNYGTSNIQVDNERSFAEDNASAEQKIPLSEFILSYFDYTTGQFPKGETAVLTMIEKDYGEQYITPAKEFMERINERVAEVLGYRNEPEIQEDDFEINRVKNLAGIF
jgi:hypothetical protein